MNELTLKELLWGGSEVEMSYKHGVGFSVLQGRLSEHHFTRVSQLSNGWRYMGQKFPSSHV